MFSILFSISTSIQSWQISLVLRRCRSLDVWSLRVSLLFSRRQVGLSRIWCGFIYEISRRKSRKRVQWLGGGNSNIFCILTPKIGDMWHDPIGLTYFSMGWFNHHLHKQDKKRLFVLKDSPPVPASNLFLESTGCTVCSECGFCRGFDMLRENSIGCPVKQSKSWCVFGVQVFRPFGGGDTYCQEETTPTLPEDTVKAPQNWKLQFSPSFWDGISSTAFRECWLNILK